MINELQTYTPDETKIVHVTSVDFNSRSNLVRPIHLVQYDDTLPVMAVTLYNSGKLYTIPQVYASNIRFMKKDGTYIYNPALGCDESRNVLYFEVTQNMTFVNGTFNPIIDLVDEQSHVAGSSSFTVIIDQNPVQEDDVESSDEFKTLLAYIRDAQESAEKADASEKAAAKSEQNAALSETNAQSYMESAQKSMEAAAASEANAAQSQQAAAQSELNADGSRTLAEYYRQLAESYAHGQTTVRDNESTDNAQFYSERAGASATSANDSATSARNEAAKAEEYLNQTIEEGANALEKLEDALKMALPEWNINFETGDLEYQGGRFNWQIEYTDGNLMWEVAV